MRCLLPIFFALMAGCATYQWTSERDHEALASLVEHSPSFQRAREVNASRVIWFVEQTNIPPHIYVGFDMGTHTCRSATLRIREQVVEREEMREDGELVWVPDR